MAHRLSTLPAFRRWSWRKGPGVRVEMLARSTQGWTGVRLPPYRGSQPQVSVRRISNPPGVRLDHPHHHPVINARVLLQGRLKVVMEDGRSLVLESGYPWWRW